MKVCITTAGLGSRMGEYQAINKALLPVEGKAAISHIIESFPRHEDFVIALGHNADQVRDYLALAHPDRTFEFVEVDAYEGPGTGPLRSLYACRDALRCSFVFVACDTLWKENVIRRRTDINWVGCSYVDTPTGYSFVEVENEGIKSSKVLSISTVPSVWETQGMAFVGLMQIADFDVFWECARRALDQGNVEIYHALSEMLEYRPIHYNRIADWRDIGTHERYHAVIEATTNFDFSKPNEFIYTVNGRVIKWFADHKITNDRVERAAMKPDMFPVIEQKRGGFYSYRFVPGETLYVRNNVPIFDDFLCWMAEGMWEETPDDITAASKEFYVTKTRQRLEMFRKKYPDWVEPKFVNGEAVKPIEQLLEEIDLESLAARAIPSFIHGDLQFDNIIHGPEGFVLLDWRQDFGGLKHVGDLYYDLAKLLGGIRLNYHYVKKNLIEFHREGDHVTIDALQGMMTSTYEYMLRRFISENGFSLRQVELILGIIYLNMAPLHAAPFDRFLYALAQRTLTEA